MSVGKVVTSFLGSKLFDFVLHILDEENAIGILDERPPGSCILRLEVPPQNQNQNSKSPLKASYKYKTFTFTHTIEKIIFKISVSKSSNVVKCKTNPKNYKYIRSLATEFLPTLRLFVNEFVNNHNFIERELDSNDQLENELIYHKFLIYPHKDRVYISKKVDKVIKTASVGFDFENLSFFVEDGETRKVIKSFNEYLLTEFLQIDFSDKILVRAALGYQKSVDLFTGKEKFSGLTQTNSAYDEFGPAIREKDKVKLIEKLSAIIHREDQSYWRMPPSEVRSILRAILESITILQTSSEKMEWIKGGILDLTQKIIQKNGNNELYNEIPITITKYLLDKNPEGCEIYCKQTLKFIDSDTEWECVGLYSSLYILVELPSFLEVFMRHLGAPKILNIYVKASIMLLGENHTNTMGDMNYNNQDEPTEIFDDEEDYSVSSESIEEDTDTFTNEKEPENISPNGGGKKLLIPKLMLKSIQIENKDAREKKNPRDKIEYKRSATEELETLAMNLGETYMTQDLTALLSQLQDDSESVKDRKAKRITVALTAISIFEDREIIPVNPTAALGFKNSCYYKIKCSILRVLARLTRNWDYFDYIPNPVNLLFSELLVSYKEMHLTYDNNFRKLIYNVLTNYSDHVEYIHRFKFRTITADFSLERVKCYRRKLDKFVWRVYNHLLPSVEAKNIDEADTHLNLLCEYMQNCPTGVMSSQVVDVCMSTLLLIKEFILSKGRFSVKNKDHAKLIHKLLEVLDQIAIQNNHGPMNEFLMYIMIETNEFWKFMMNYAGHVLMNKAFEKVISGVPRSTEGRTNLKKYRAQVFKHYTVCLMLIQRQVSFYEKEELKQVPFAKEARENVTKYLNDFEFLLHPHTGFILQLLNSNKGSFGTFSLQKEILLFLIEVFTPKYSVYLTRRSYIDAYISYSYLNFIKLYHSVSQDENTLELIHLNLMLLITFAKNKNEKITMKFYQLRVMDFLVREVNLEYEITLSKYLKKKVNKAPELEKAPDNSKDVKEVKEEKFENTPSKEDKKKSSSWKKEDDKKETGKDEVKKKGSWKKEDEEENIKRLSSKGSKKEDDIKNHKKDSKDEPKKKGSWKKEDEDKYREDKKSSRGSWKKDKKDDIEDDTKRHSSKINDEISKRRSKGSWIKESRSLKSRGSWIKEERKNDKRGIKDLKEEKKSMSAIYLDSNIGSPPQGRKKEPLSKSQDILPSISDLIAKQQPSKPKETIGSFLDSVAKESESKALEIKSPEVAKNKGSRLVIPGLSLNAESTKDGVARIGKSTVVQQSSSDEEESDESEEGSTEESSSEEESSEEELPPPKKLPFSIPKLTDVPLKADQKAPPKFDLGTSIPKLTNIPLKGDAGIGSLAIPKLTNVPIKGDKSANSIHASNDKGKQLNLVKNSDVKLGGLSDLERKIDVNDPKFQLIFDNKKKDTNNEDEKEAFLTKDDMQELSEIYITQRNEHKIYSNLRVHVGILQLIFSLMLTQIGTLENLYSDQFPLDNKKLNIPFLLRAHLSHPANRKIIPTLRNELYSMGVMEFRLFKLMCTRLFRKELYQDLKRLATGAYGTVYSCNVKSDLMDVAIKLMEIPKSIHDRCVLHGIFDEVLILDKFKLDPRISHVYDYGTDDDYYWIVMKKYKCSLKHWRKKQTAPLTQNLALYLNIYMNILNSFQFLFENKVNHFDVKCDNFLIQPLNEENWTAEDEEFFWHPTSDIPNFSVCLADFGESKIFETELDGYTTRNRGTEFTKSPEMLVVAYASQKTRSTYDRRKKVGASSPSDVWSLGCLLYELLTGEFLFYDQDWVRFFIRVTSPGQELLTPEKIEKIDNNQVLVEFMKFILRRDPAYRPSVSDVITRFKYVRARLTSSSPSLYSPRIPTPRKNENSLTSSDNKENNKEESKIINNEEKKSEIPESESSHNIKQITEKKRLIDSYAEAQYFLENFSQLTEYLYLGAIMSAYNYSMTAKEHKITHIVNCTKLDIPRSNEFYYLQAPLDKNEPKEFAVALNQIISFINDARLHKGIVLVVSEDGVSRCAAVVVGYLMETRNWSFLEAHTLVKDSRYIIEIDEELVEVLVEWKKKEKSNKRQYQCLCGACVVTVLSSFNQSYFPNPRGCCCKVDEPSKCPNTGCYEFLAQMRSLYQYPATEVMWGYTTSEYLAKGEYSRSTREYIPTKELGEKAGSQNKGWTLFRCISCDFLTHALKVKTGEQKSQTNMPNFDVAVVTNLPVASRSSL